MHAIFQLSILEEAQRVKAGQLTHLESPWLALASKKRKRHRKVRLDKKVASVANTKLIKFADYKPFKAICSSNHEVNGVGAKKCLQYRKQCCFNQLEVSFHTTVRCGSMYRALRVTYTVCCGSKYRVLRVTLPCVAGHLGRLTV